MKVFPGGLDPPHNSDENPIQQAVPTPTILKTNRLDQGCNRFYVVPIEAASIEAASIEAASVQPALKK